MALIRHINWVKSLRECLIVSNLDKYEMGRNRRWYCANNKSKNDWNNLRSMIKKRIENRSNFYPLRSMIPVAQQVLQSRSQLIFGVSTLLKVLPVFTCEFCPEVYVGDTGHLIQSCWGYKRLKKNQLHTWIKASLNDILVPIETFQLDTRVKDVIKHHQRFDFERIPAVIELCHQAGAHLEDSMSDLSFDEANSLSKDDLRVVGIRTLKAWEMLREGVKKLLLVYPAKICKHCSEIHVGPTGHKAPLYGSWQGYHFWEKADVDDLVPPKIVWYRRPQDPPALLNEGRNYYGHAPAVVDLCCKAGAIPPVKHVCMMKVQGLTKPSLDKVLG